LRLGFGESKAGAKIPKIESEGNRGKARKHLKRLKPARKFCGRLICGEEIEIFARFPDPGLLLTYIRLSSNFNDFKLTTFSRLV
jgi:hypothetical protein